MHRSCSIHCCSPFFSSAPSHISDGYFLVNHNQLPISGYCLRSTGYSPSGHKKTTRFAGGIHGQAALLLSSCYSFFKGVVHSTPGLWILSRRISGILKAVIRPTICEHHVFIGSIHIMGACGLFPWLCCLQADPMPRGEQGDRLLWIPPRIALAVVCLKNLIG